MALESEEEIKALDEYSEVLKHELLFLTAERKPEKMSQIIKIKRELDKVAEEKMRLNQIYYGSTSSIALTATNA